MERIGEKKEAIRDMLPRLWPLFLKNRELGPGQVAGLEHLRRNYAWLRSVYNMVRQRLVSLRAEQSELNANLQRLQRVEQNISHRLASIEDNKDELLEQKLVYLNKLQEVRAEQLAKREQLERIREAIDDLRYRLKNAKKRAMAKLKGRLPWPAKGEMVPAEEGEGASGRGLAFSLQKGEKVRSVAWGKVVYNDKLRGFGRVVIILHSQDYYSLYAYLLSSKVEMGQRIDKGEVIGRAGFYPQLNGPGLYFELRQGQRPIDPRPWLAERSGKG
jgi:septal ring factor EnvC (AmiA/AmiB activator)